MIKGRKTEFYEHIKVPLDGDVERDSSGDGMAKRILAARPTIQWSEILNALYDMGLMKEASQLQEELLHKV